MPTPETSEILLARLIEIGKIAEIDYPRANAEIAALGLTRWSMPNFGVGEYRRAFKDIPNNDDLGALARALTIVDETPGLSLGSVALVIGALQELVIREYADMPYLDRWIQRISKNPWVIGSSWNAVTSIQVARELSALSESIEQMQSYLISRRGEMWITGQLHSWFTGIFDAERRIEAAETTNRALAEKLSDSDRDRRALEIKTNQDLRNLKHNLRNEIRANVVGKGQTSSAKDRLIFIYENLQMPVLAFPDDWACDNPETLSALDSTVRDYFRSRISKVHKGPWKKMYRALKNI
jgi:hypothetical protein